MAISNQARCPCGETVSAKGLCKPCYGRRYYSDNRSKLLETEQQRYRTDKEFRERKRTQARERNARVYRELRAQVLKAHGGQCERCGFKDPRALQFDHIQGGGVKQSKELNWKKRLDWMIENPTKIQILCANCNWIKKAENGEQPPGPPRRFRD